MSRVGAERTEPEPNRDDPAPTYSDGERVDAGPSAEVRSTTRYDTARHNNAHSGGGRTTIVFVSAAQLGPVINGVLVVGFTLLAALFCLYLAVRWVVETLRDPSMGPLGSDEADERARTRDRGGNERRGG